MAYPTKFTPARADRAVKLAAQGAFVETIADEIGVNKTTLYDWLRRGGAEEPAEGDEPYVKFYLAFRAAERRFEAALLAKIDAGERDWKAAAWRLERRFPDRYSRRLKTEVSAPDGGPVQHEHQVHGNVAVYLPAEDPIPAASDAPGGSMGTEPGAAGAVPAEPDV